MAKRIHQLLIEKDWLECINLSGQLLGSYLIHKMKQDVTIYPINVSHLNPGLYIIALEQNATLNYAKFLVE